MHNLRIRFLQKIRHGGNGMCGRLLLTDEAWAEMAPLLAAIKSRAGSPPALSDRLLIDAASIAPARGYPGATCQPILGPGTQSTTTCAAGKHTVAGASSGNASRRRIAMMPARRDRCDDCRGDGHAPERRHSPWIEQRLLFSEAVRKLMSNKSTC
jgi:hypothetical protein